MKNKILTFIIGVLVGAILTTTGFLFYTKTMNKNMRPNREIFMEQNGQMQRPNGEMRQPPEKPQGDFNPTMQKR